MYPVAGQPPVCSPYGAAPNAAAPRRLPADGRVSNPTERQYVDSVARRGRSVAAMEA